MEVNRDTGLEPGETQTKCLSRIEPGNPIDLHGPGPPRLTVHKNSINDEQGRGRRGVIGVFLKNQHQDLMLIFFTELVQYMDSRFVREILDNLRLINGPHNLML